MRFHTDERRTFFGDVFSTPFGDINVVRLVPGTVIAWHRHQHQIDQILCIDGDVTIKMWTDMGAMLHEWNFTGPRDGRAVIPANEWHGYSTENGATLLQFNGPGKWDGSDEERHPIDDEMPWNLPTP